MGGDEPRESVRVVRFGMFEADLESGELRREGMPVKLQGQPFRLLALLVQRPGSIVTRDELRAALWSDGTVVDFEYGLNTAMKKIRYALGDSVEAPRFIQTLPRKGYRFIAPVTPEAQPVPTPSRMPERRRVWMIAGVLGVVVFAGLWLALLRRGSEPADVPLPLTSYPGLQYAAAFSPDGSQLAFAWNGPNEDNFDIYVKAKGAGSPTRITTDSAPDLSPAWSPDGRRIAFLRDLGERRVAIMMIPATGGLAVKVAETDAPLVEQYRNLAFTPDGRWLISTASEPNSKAKGLFLFSTENGASRRLTQPSEGYDIHPALSPDGRSLAFLRGPDLPSVDLYVLSLNPDWSPSGESRRVTFWNRFTLSPAWTRDGSEIIVASGEYFSTRLWRVPISGSAKASLITSAGDEVALPAFAPDGRLVYSQRRKHVTIATLDLAARGEAGSRLRRWPGSSSRIDTHPRFSPDGRRVAFVSTRSGAKQVWIANADGSGAVQLTSLSATFVDFPNWSSNGMTIVFRAMQGLDFNFYTIGAAGGTPRLLMRSRTRDAMPTFSADGRSIYFHSNRGGSFQVWRMPAQGGEAVQLTHAGGEGPRESPDGRYLYFARTAPKGPISLWRMPSAGGEETKLFEPLLGESFDPTEKGVYYVRACGKSGECPIQFYSFATGGSTLLASGLTGNNGLAVSPDGTTLLRAQVTDLGADLMVLENFR